MAVEFWFERDVDAARQQQQESAAISGETVEAERVGQVARGRRPLGNASPQHGAPGRSKEKNQSSKKTL